MGCVRGVEVIVAIFAVAVSVGGGGVGAYQHHVVGGDRGWDPDSDLASWLAGRIFRVGDYIWLAYSAAQHSVAKEEYDSCNVTIPIRMFRGGIDKILLEGEGIRYFASSNSESCREGLKLHVEVLPRDSRMNTTSGGSALAVAAGPTTPSTSTRLAGFSSLFWVGLGLTYLGL